MNKTTSETLPCGFKWLDHDVGTMSELERALFEITTLLTQSGYEYAVMGGLAVRVDSIPRPTYDVDLTVSIERSELPKLFQSLERLGFTIPAPYQQGWVDEVGGMPLIKVKTYINGSPGVAIDIFLSETDFQKSCLKRRFEITLDGRSLWVIAPEDLILLKLLAARPRDLLDVADILFTQGHLDETYLRQWAKSLDIADRLEKALTDARSEQQPASTN